MKEINLFFACDDAYLPFLAVTLTSVKENRDPARRYAVRVLHTGLRRENICRVSAMAEPDFSVEFCDISGKMADFAEKFHTRDYYSASTYYRLFIPELFPELDKALYLDSDLVVRGDISRLYDTELGENLVGAVPDGIINTVRELGLYAVKRLDLPTPERYFNAGVLLMNLREMRQCRFAENFVELLGAVTFRVAQDQDYLNVLCRDRVTYLGYEWNTMPTGIRTESPLLIHYNLDGKPWQRDDVAFGEAFWDHAERSGFYEELRDIRRNYSREQAERGARQTREVIALGYRQAMDEPENRRLHQTYQRVVNL